MEVSGHKYEGDSKPIGEISLNISGIGGNANTINYGSDYSFKHGAIVLNGPIRLPRTAIITQADASNDSSIDKGEIYCDTSGYLRLKGAEGSVLDTPRTILNFTFIPVSLSESGDEFNTGAGNKFFVRYRYDSLNSDLAALFS